MIFFMPLTLAGGLGGAASNAIVNDRMTKARHKMKAYR